MAGGIATAAAAIGQQLLGSGVLEGSGTSDSKGKSNTKGRTLTNTSGTQNTKGLTVDKGVQVGKGYSKGSNIGVGTTINKGDSSTSGGTTINQTTKGTADQGAIDRANNISDQALKAVNDKSAINGLINSTLGKAAISFAPTLAAGTAGSGLYNSSTVDLLSGFAKGQAVADSTAAVLQYQQGEQQIATQANQGVLDATKGSTVTGGTTNTSDTSTLNSGATTSKDLTSNTNVNINKSTDTNKSNQTTNTSGTSSTATDNTTNTSGHVKQDSESQQNGLLDDSIICTELMKQGKLDKTNWKIGAKHFNSGAVPMHGKLAYFAWSTPVVRHIKKYPEGKITKLFSFLMKGRNNGIAWYYHKATDFSVSNILCWFVIEAITHVTGLYTVRPKQVVSWIRGV